MVRRNEALNDARRMQNAAAEETHDRIFRRPTQSAGQPVRKKKDEHARMRNVILNFRVSPRERDLIERRIALSGMPKGEFFIQSCLYQAILVKANIRAIDRIRKSVREIDEKLQMALEAEADGGVSADGGQRRDHTGLNQSLAAVLDEGALTELRTILELLDSVYRRGGIDHEED